jgi:hypothetical protein
VEGIEVVNGGAGSFRGRRRRGAVRHREKKAGGEEAAEYADRC